MIADRDIERIRSLLEFNKKLRGLLGAEISAVTRSDKSQAFLLRTPDQSFTFCSAETSEDLLLFQDIIDRMAEAALKPLDARIRELVVDLAGGEYGRS